MTTRGINRLCASVENASAWIGPLESGHRPDRQRGVSQIRALLAQVFKQKEGSMFERLREWYLDAVHKSGDHRRELDVTPVLVSCLDGSCGCWEMPSVGWPWRWMQLTWVLAGPSSR